MLICRLPQIEERNRRQQLDLSLQQGSQSTILMMIPHLTMSSMMSLMRSVLKPEWLKLVAILISYAQHFIQGQLKGRNIIIPDDEA